MAYIILAFLTVFTVIGLIYRITGKLSTVFEILATIINWGMIIAIVIACAFMLIQSESFGDFAMALFGLIVFIFCLVAFISSAKESRQKRKESEKRLEELKRRVQAKAPLQEEEEEVKQEPNVIIEHSEALEKRKQLLKNIQMLNKELGTPPGPIHPDLYELFRKHAIYLLKNVEPNRIINAINTDLEIKDAEINSTNPLNAIIRSGENEYLVQPRECNCPDFSNRHKPCKHMIFLAHAVGVFETIPEEAFEKALEERGETK